MQKPFTMLTASALAVLIGRIGKTSVLREKMIQEAAVQCVVQSILHSNVTPAISLFDACGKGTRRDSLVAYLEMWGQIAYLKSEGKMGFFRRDTLVLEATDETVGDDGKPVRTMKEAYIEKIVTALWYNAKPEPKIKSVFDADKEISSVLERLQKSAGKQGVEVANKPLLNHMIEAYNRFTFDNFAKGTTDVTDQENAEKKQDQTNATIENAEREGASPDKIAELKAKFAPLQQAA